MAVAGKRPHTRDDLPEDILLEIFSRPKQSSLLKSLLKCQCVSRRWRDIIERSAYLFPGWMNDHVFMVAHRFEKDEWPRFYRLDFNGSKGGGSAGSLIYDHYIESLLPITGCLYRSATYFNGVVFYAKVLIQDGFRYDISYDIYNPLSRCKSTVRPITPFLHGDPVLLGYAPSTHPTFHDRNDPFKFVVFHGLMRYGRYRAMVSIFDSGRTKTDDTWETEQVIYSDDRVFYHLPLVSASSSYPSCFYLRGMLHWIQISCILVFCLDTHTLGLIELPVQSGILPGGGCLWESEGRLHYCQIYPSHDIGLCIWVLDEHPGAVLKGSIQASDWRKIFGLSQQKFNSMLTEAGRRPFTSTTRVCAFDERLLMIHLETPQGPLCYDMYQKKLIAPLLPSDDSPIILL